ncbi:cytosolic endo-beta-N-acetylglucosaminidase [Anthonomus grandis grandis]|uniref:cytosolic endo-beta-N-acetylglucosaminidase n=1 Tax=Anthonomus grandis grandis TaxID=2921223 RepID=UPI002165CB2B|nr:cytosolic endo-beta-N-acetylglucosaminidase [Anthonomus grandis grandis]
MTSTESEISSNSNEIEVQGDKMFPSFTQCRPISHPTDIEECLKDPPEWVNRVMPLKKRSGYVIKNVVSDCHRIEGQIRERTDCRTVPKTLVCHDYKGGYLGDSYVPFEGSEDKTLVSDGYPFYNWSQIDYFVYFSHHFITIPPLAWTNTGHKNGVKVLGTIITENLDGVKICDDIIFASEGVMKEFVYQLTDIQRIFGFDGWLLNIENPVKNPFILKHFVNLLTQRSHEQNSESVVIWYDSVTKDGLLKWQDQLNEENRCYFDGCDGIFLNYGWNEEKLKTSLKNAGTRAFDVFVGIDVFGRNMFGGGQFTTFKATQAVRKYNLSMAIFAPGWTHETMDKERTAVNSFSTFLNRDDTLWASLWPYLYTHPINEFFQTDFHLGLDSNYYNLYNQNRQISKILTPQHWQDLPSELPIATFNTSDCLKRAFFESRNVCLITSEGLQGGNVQFKHRLFSCDLKLQGRIGVFYLIRHKDDSDLEVQLVTCGNSGSIKTIKLLSSKKELLRNNSSVLEVNYLDDSSIKYLPVFNSMAKRHLRILNSYRGSVSLRMFEFYTTSCDLLDIEATLVSGLSVLLLEFGIFQL